MNMLVVCAAVVQKQDKILLAQRKAEGAQGLLWEFPGGKLICGESPKDCLIREIREELDMQIEVGDVLEVVSHIYQVDTQILLLAYWCRHLSGEGRKADCNDFVWVEPSAIHSYNLSAADIPVWQKLQRFIERGLL